MSRAADAHSEGLDALDAGRLDEAEARFREVIALAPKSGSAWFNLSLIHKRRHEWEALRDTSRIAAALEENSEGALWNLGIAAAALGDWQAAREAWPHFGLKLPREDGPWDFRLGLTPIRVSPDDKPEVVWCERLDPARAIIRSVPTPASGRRHGDLLLHDGEPRGKRRLGEREVSVFDELEVLAPSSASTFRVELAAESDDAIDALGEEVSATGAALEDWTGSIEMLCAQCSLGTPHEHAPPAVEPQAWNSRRSIGIAAEDFSRVEPILQRWAGAVSGRAVSSVELALPGVLKS